MTTLMTNTIYTLVRKGFTVHHAATAREAADLVMNLIPEGASVGFGGSVTVRDMGLYEALKETGRVPTGTGRTTSPSRTFSPAP